MRRTAMAVVSLLVGLAATAGAQILPADLERTDVKALVGEFRLAAARDKSASGGAQVRRPAADTLVQYGTVCRIGKDPTDALARVMSTLNDPVIKLETDFSVYTGSRQTGEYLKGPYAIVGQAVSTRISIIAGYNWLSCLPVQGQPPAAR